MFRPMPRYGQQLELKKGICTPIHTIVQMPFWYSYYRYFFKGIHLI